jgi:hypothetical protein
MKMNNGEPLPTDEFLDEVASHLTAAKLANMEIATRLIEASATYHALRDDASQFKASLDELRKGMKGSDKDMWLKSLYFSSKTNSSEMIFITVTVFIFAQRHNCYYIHNHQHRAAITYIYYQTLQDAINEELKDK